MNSRDNGHSGALEDVRLAGGATCEAESGLAQGLRGGDARGVGRGPAPGWLRYVGVALALTVGMGLGACGANGDPGTDSTTHFWETCDADEECGAGAACICGYCTWSCDDSCAVAGAQCVNASVVIECEHPTQVCVPEAVLLQRAPSIDASVVGATTGDASVNPESEMPITSDEAGTAEPMGATTNLTTNPPTDETVTFEGTGDDTSGQDQGVATTSESAFTTDTTSTDSENGETAGLAPPLLKDYLTAGTSWDSWRGDRLQAASGCQVQAFLAESDRCSYGVGCNEHGYQVACSDAGGVWDCQCSYPEMTSLSGFVSFSTTAPDSSTACEATFQACTTPAEKYDCTVTPMSTESTEYACQWQQSCTMGSPASEAEVTDGAYTGHCTAGDGFSLCTCEGSNWDRTYVIEEVPSSEACDVARQACRAAPDPVTWQKPDCVDDVRTEGQQCQVERSCPLVAELSSQVTALSKLSSSSWCNLEGANQLCSCENDNGRLHWINAPPGGTEECVAALDVCQRSSEIEFEGGPQCRSTSGMDELGACSRKERCVSSGTFDDQLMTFIMDIEVGCSRSNDADDWSCSCTAGSRSASATRNGSVNVADACTQQLSDCRALVEFDLDAIEVP